MIAVNLAGLALIALIVWWFWLPGTKQRELTALTAQDAKERQE